MRALGMFGAGIIIAISLGAAPPAAAAAGAETALAQRLFQRLTGTPLGLDDPRLPQMAALVKAGKLTAAAAVATDDDNFYGVTLKTLAVSMSNRAETPYADFTDFAAMVVGVARDDLDARTLLTGNFSYQASDDQGLNPVSTTDNQHYQSIDAGHLSLKTVLVRKEPQRADLTDTAGVLTSRAWAEAHMKDGTNRRAMQFTFQEFLCSPITKWKDAGLPDFHVRRDVTRAPGNDPATYEGTCRNCHSIMDAMGGAFAHYDFQNQALVYFGGGHVAPKLNRHGDVYPDGWVTRDDSWFNQATQNSNAAFGWRGPLAGNGLNAFGTMVANSAAFSQCFAKRAFSSVCKRDPEAGDAAALAQAATDFEAGGYKLKALFAEVAILPACIGTLNHP